jgi:hypothetical protein
MKAQAVDSIHVLSSFPSNHLLCLWQSETQSIHVPSEEEEQEVLSSPRIRKQGNARHVNSFLQLPLTKQGRGATLTAGAS